MTSFRTAVVSTGALILGVATAHSASSVAATALAPDFVPVDESATSDAFVPMTPMRVVNTRTTGIPIGELDGTGDPLVLDLTTIDAIPDNISAVALNVTVVNGTTNDNGGFVTVYPCGNIPDASNLNFTTGQTIPNAVIAPVSNDNTICFHVYGTTHLLADISGYFTNGFTPVVPERMLNTRSGERVGELDGAGDRVELQVTGSSIPSSATAVAMNVTVVDGAANDNGGFVTVYPCGNIPDASNLNFTTGQTIPNAVIAPLSSSGAVCFHLYGTAHLLVDVSGYFTDGFTTMTPMRVVNTRTTGIPIGELDGTGDPLVLDLTTIDAIPDNISAVALNVTVVNGTTNDNGGFVTVYPCGNIPDASNLNFTTGQTIPNAVIAPVSNDNTICFHVYGTTHLLADISGYFTDTSTVGAPSTPSTDPVTASTDVVRPGGAMRVTAAGFRPASEVRIELHSEPVLLDVVPADGSGQVGVDVTIPDDTPSGDHEIVVVGVDPDDSPVEYRTPVSVDRDGPTIPTVTVTPSSAAVGDQVVISVSAVDPAGVDEVSFSTSIGDAQRDICGQQLTFESGSDTEATWSTTCTIPTTAQNGEYTITPFALDGVGNYTNTNCCSTSSTRGSFTVTGGSDDSDGPAFASVTVSDSSVSPGERFVISIRATDASGVRSAGFYLTLDSAQRDICGQSTTLTSGDAFDGVWTYECTVPANAQNGDYTITPLGEDVVGNYTNTNCCSTSSTRGSFTVTGGSDDSDGPAIPSVTATPTTVGPGTSLTISIRVTDTSGVESAGFYLTLEGAQRDICGQNTTLTSGDAFDGVWTYTCTIPAVVQGGTYTVVPFAVDRVGNYTNTNCCSTSPTRATFVVQ